MSDQTTTKLPRPRTDLPDPGLTEREPKPRRRRRTVEPREIIMIILMFIAGYVGAVLGMITVELW